MPFQKHFKNLTRKERIFAFYNSIVPPFVLNVKQKFLKQQYLSDFLQGCTKKQKIYVKKSKYY